jgi:hypothetical protein
MKALSLKTAVISGLAALSLSSSVFASGNFELSLSNSSVYAEASSSNDAAMQVAAGYLYHEESRNVINVDFNAQNQRDFHGHNVHLGVGIRGMAYREHETDGIGIGLGGFGEIDITEAPGLSLGASAYYSPNILTFSDSENILWAEAVAAYAIIPNAKAQIGYRYIHAEFQNNQDFSVEASAFAGIKFEF